MILKKDNVERIADEYGAKVLMRKGFVPLGAVEKPEKKEDIGKMKTEDLRKLVAEKGIEGAESLNKQELLKVLKEVGKDD